MFPRILLLFGMLFTMRGTKAQSVTQPDGHITVSEGDSLELKCSYSYGGAIYLFWYVQYPSQGLQLLLKYVTGATLVTGIKGFKAEFRKNETSFHLRKLSTHWSDSAVYFCALSGTVPETAGGAVHKPPETLEFSDSKTQADLFLATLSFDETEQDGGTEPWGVLGS